MDFHEVPVKVLKAFPTVFWGQVNFMGRRISLQEKR
jgi:hypothetical protein